MLAGCAELSHSAVLRGRGVLTLVVTRYGKKQEEEEGST